MVVLLGICIHEKHAVECSFTSRPLIIIPHHPSPSIHCLLDRYTRIGSVILLLHDPSDILLELAKLLNYAGKEALSTLAFASMMLSWAALRLWIFPTYVVHSAMYEMVLGADGLTHVLCVVPHSVQHVGHLVNAHARW